MIGYDVIGYTTDPCRKIPKKRPFFGDFFGSSKVQVNKSNSTGQKKIKTDNKIKFINSQVASRCEVKRSNSSSSGLS